MALLRATWPWIGLGFVAAGACSLEWDKYDPRLGAVASGGLALAGGGGHAAGQGGAAVGGAAGSAVGGSGGAGASAGGAAGGACPGEQCRIGDDCVAAGEPNPDNPCEACVPPLSGNGWTAQSASPICAGDGYWTGVSHAMPLTPYGRRTAVSCHNCYAASIGDTLTKLHAAQSSGADLLELDLKDEDGVVYVQHDDNGTVNGPRLVDVLADSALRAGDELLFIELKEQSPTASFLGQVLTELRDAGFAVAGRPVVLRSFDAVRDNLLFARSLLASADFIDMRPHVRLHVLLPSSVGSNVPSMHQLVRDSFERGFHGVEPQYTTPNLMSAIAFATSLGLATSVWTIPDTFGEVFVASLRDEVDAITVDYPVALAHDIVEADNGLVYLNAAAQDAGHGTITWYAAGISQAYTAAVDEAGAPSTESLGQGEPRFGTSLGFDPAGSQFLTFYDGDNDPTAGYFVAVAAQIDVPALPDGETQVLLGKAMGSGFSLELANIAGPEPTVLRFAAYVGAGYSYASIPASSLDSGALHWILAGYDGAGAVRLWVDNVAAGASAMISGPVVPNDLPILAGADPEVGDPRYFFDGKLQLALVQRWADH